MAAPTATATKDHAATADAEERAQQHEMDIGEREAYEYWGYMFQKDKTGTDKLKKLLRGLKDVINSRYDPSDQPDLTPNQLAHFYRDLHGNYDQLFVDTPHESIAFIYKSLGCLHSLQPIHHTHATAFTDPTVPSLKTEGWIMWQTIQILLGPEEHSGFIREAVANWDITDSNTGVLFPKIMPRQCFPTEPDKHMVAWYEGVSERLKREAEEEERRRESDSQHDDAEPRRLKDRMPQRREGELVSEDDASVDSKGPALAYFRDPLYRHDDGRPSIVRRNSKRPALSPRPTFVDKGKGAASTFSHIVRNVGSPHLWDGRGGSRSASRDRDRDRRRKSNPDAHHRHHSGGDPISAGSHGSHPSPRQHPAHRHRLSTQLDRPATAGSADGEWDEDDTSPVYSPVPLNTSRHKHHHHRGSTNSKETPLRHSRSHDPTPTQHEADDYFADYDNQSSRRSSVNDNGNTATPPSRNNGSNVGPSFGPSASPLFASHVARQPHHVYPPNPRINQVPPTPTSADQYEGGPPARNPSIRRAQEGYASQSPGRSPAPDPRRASLDRPYNNPRPDRFNRSPAPYEGRPPSSAGGPPGGGGRHHDRAPGRHQDPPQGERYPPDNRERDGRGRMSGSDVSGYYSADDGRRSKTKQTRFADQKGVSGRRYPEEAPWQRQD